MRTIPQPTEEQEHRFWSRVQRTPDTCWNWIGSVSGTKHGVGGYGSISIGGQGVDAHRLSASLTMDDFDPTLHVLHRCDNTRCVRPSHLFQGTNADNIRDAMTKGRSYVGSARHIARLRNDTHPRAKLTSAQVVAIRERYAQGGITQAELGAQFGVSGNHISNLVRKRGYFWKGI